MKSYTIVCPNCRGTRMIGRELDIVCPSCYATGVVDNSPCASGCKPSEGNVCGGPRCT